MGTVILYDTTSVYFEEISETHVLTLFLLYKKCVPNEPPAVSSFSLPLQYGSDITIPLSNRILAFSHL